MKIKEIAIGYISIPLVTPFRTALRVVDQVNDLIVRVTAEDGTEGFGEAPPTAVITGDTRESIEAAIRGYIAPAIRGMELDDIGAIMARMEKSIAKNTSAKAAVDIALYDLCARLKGMPLYRFLQREAGKKASEGEPPVFVSGTQGTGDAAAQNAALGKTGAGASEETGAEKGSAAADSERNIAAQNGLVPETDLTISVNDTPEMVRDSLRAVQEGFRILKVKVGKGGAKDVERVREIRRAVGRDIVIRVDANQGWTVEEAIATIRAMEDEGLAPELVEQPVSCHNFRGLQRVTQQVHTPVLADESVFSYEDAARIIEEHAADYINIKLMKTGGLHEAMRICDLAEKNQVKCMIGCMLESKVSVSAGAHLAAARNCVTMADLDGPSLCSIDPYEGGPLYAGPQIQLNQNGGLGITGVPVKFAAV